MGDHYVPRAYLRGFCEASSEMIFTCEKGSGRYFKSNVKNVAQENGFYPQDVEQRLATDIEEPGNEILRKIYRQEAVNDQDKIIFSTYMAVMMKRVPKHRHRLEVMIPDVMQGTFDKLFRGLEQARKVYPQDKIDRRLKEAEDLQEQYRKHFPSNLLVQFQEPWSTPRVVAAIASMRWRFGLSSGPSYFLTSDNPLTFFECWGVGSAESEIAFPLSSTVVLHASYQAGPDLIYLPMSQSLVKEINRRNVQSATRFLFYHKQEKWVEDLARKRRDARELSRIFWSN